MGSGFSIKLINRHKKYKINESLLKKIIKEILGLCERRLKNIELEIVFLDDPAIRQLNKRFKKRDRPTDVLSFGIKAGESGRPFLGEIFISLDRALENSKIYKTDFGQELVLYVIHGILHLFGYDDESAAARRRMSKKERSVLRFLWKREDLSKVLTRR